MEGHIVVIRKRDTDRDVHVLGDMMFRDDEERSRSHFQLLTKMALSATAPGLNAVSGRRFLLIAKYKRT
jgi:hypothetical protein